MTNKVEQKYRKVSQIDHVLLRPEMYVGSVETEEIETWLFKSKNPERIFMPRLLPSGPVFDKAYCEVQNGFDEEEDEEEIKKCDSQAFTSLSENEINKDIVNVSAEDGEKLNNFAVKHTFVEVDGKVDGIDLRLIVPNKVDHCFPPGTLIIDRVFFNSGLLKIVDEILVNAADNRLSSTVQTEIRVYFDKESGEISISNDGESIPIVKHSEHDIFIPELIFGHLLTSSHYDNNAISVAAGRHGYGAKLTNILSKKFSVECISRGKKIVCRWENHMKKFLGSNIENFVGPERTTVTFTPDYKIFSKFEETITPPENFDIKIDLDRLLMKRCLDISASIGSSINVYYNDILITPRTFSDYTRMHLPPEVKDFQPFTVSSNNCTFGVILMSNSNDKYIKIPSECLVNGIHTIHGGSHLTAARMYLDAAINKLAVKLKKEKLILQTYSLKAHCIIFVNQIVEQPKFDSQSKSRLVSKHSFPQFSVDTLMKHIKHLPNLRQFCFSEAANEISQIEKLLKTKTKNLTSMIPKLVEPPDMRMPPHEPRTLILTEGDSAKALVLSALSTEQRKTFGVFPLRGKIVNARTNTDKVKTNRELINVFLIMGLSPQKKFKDVNELRYQRVIVMTDQDPDGIHIRGLILNAFEYLWPDLLLHNMGFISFFNTPLIKASLTASKKSTSFFSTNDFLHWRESLTDSARDKLKVKYYKGLGTNTSEEGREYFNAINDYLSEIDSTQRKSGTLSKLEGAFGCDAGWRRQWLKLKNWSEETNMHGIKKIVPIEEFVDTELIQYAAYDNHRMLPSVLDGFKVCQRKILWAMRKKNSSTSQRVSQISGYVSEVAMFHHGEASMQQVIINMAQEYVGSNNISWLTAEGQFGSRLTLGQDAAAPRYIFTKIDNITQYFFPPEDDELLEYCLSDGEPVEPKYYVPIIPTILLNLSFGIGVGFAARANLHDPLSIIEATRAMVNGSSEVDAEKLLRFAVNGYKGIIENDPLIPGCAKITGRVHFHINYPSSSKLVSSQLVSLSHVICRITEIPYTISIENYREFLNRHFGDDLTSITDLSRPNSVEIIIKMRLLSFLRHVRTFDEEGLLESLGLVSNFRSLYTCLDREARVHEFGISRHAILRYHYAERLQVYVKRLEMRKQRLRSQIERQKSNIIFAEFVRKNGSKILSLGEEELSNQLKEAGAVSIKGSFSYLLNKPFSSLLDSNVSQTKEKCSSIEKELEYTMKQTPQSLWLDELNAAQAATETYLKNRRTKILKEAGEADSSFKDGEMGQSIKNKGKNSWLTPNDFLHSVIDVMASKGFLIEKGQSKVFTSLTRKIPSFAASKSKKSSSSVQKTSNQNADIESKRKKKKKMEEKQDKNDTIEKRIKKKVLASSVKKAQMGSQALMTLTPSLCPVANALTFFLFKTSFSLNDTLTLKYRYYLSNIVCPDQRYINNLRFSAFAIMTNTFKRIFRSTFV